MRCVGVLVGVVLALGGGAAQAAGLERLYLLNAPGGTAYYSPDAQDPEAPGSGLGQRCNVFLNPQPVRMCQYSFLPAVALDAPLTWGPEAPLRFHAELSVDSPIDRTVTFFVQSGAKQHETPPATEVAPGVWEAQLSAPGAAAPGQVTVLGVRLRGTGPSVAMHLRTGGRSWVDLGRPATGSSVPELLRASPAATAPQALITAERRFAFADDDWSAWRFDGRLDADRTFKLAVPRDAAALYAWVESPGASAVHAAAGGTQPDPRWLTDHASVELRRDGVSFGDGGNDSRADNDVPAGPIEVVVRRSPQAVDASYVLRVVAVHGVRTLRAMRWQTTIGSSLRAGLVSVCPQTFDPVVVPEAATTYSVGLTWSSPDPTDQWAISYDVPTVGSVVCGDRTTDTFVRLVPPRATRVALFSPRVAGDLPSASAEDTVFEFDARLAYAPAS